MLAATRPIPVKSKPPRPGVRWSAQRVRLQLQGPRNVRRHVARAAARVATLLVADVMVYLGARELLRALRDSAVLGTGLANLVAAVIPHGVWGGWQLATALVIGLAVMGNYRQGNRRRDATRLLVGVALGAVLSFWYPLWHGGAAVATQFVATAAGMWLAFLMERLAIDAVVLRLKPGAHHVERVVFVGNPIDEAAIRVQRQLLSRGKMASAGWISTNGTNHAGVIGSVRNFWQLLQRTAPETVVVCGRLADEHFEAVVNASSAAGCRLLAVPRYDGLADLLPGVVWQRGLPFVDLTMPWRRAGALLLKRLIDIVGSLIGLALVSPIALAAAAAIKLDSRGPVLFAQERVGFGGRVFRMLKFRTMRVGADQEKEAVAHLNHTGDPRLFKILGDPRVTRVGAWLRRWSLDELPQLLNVLRGDMSLVGPRPFFQADLAGYSDHHYVRLGAKPGITGLWQVSGRSSVVDFEEVVRLDSEYVDRWSHWLDVKILFRTVPAVVRRTGAY